MIIEQCANLVHLIGLIATINQKVLEVSIFFKLLATGFSSYIVNNMNWLIASLNLKQCTLFHDYADDLITTTPVI